MVLLLPVKEIAYWYVTVLKVHTAVSYSLLPKFLFVQRSYSGNGDNMSSTMAKEGNITFR